MTKFKSLPSVERLAEVFYLEEDGILKWKKKPHPRCRHIEPGAVAGSKKEDGYWRVTIDGSTYYSHRIAWKMATGQDPGQLEIDHINRDRSDNRASNLRLVTTAQNSLNRNAVGGATGEPCVFRTGRNRSPFKVIVNGCHIGSFSSIEHAARARDKYRLAASNARGLL